MGWSYSDLTAEIAKSNLAILGGVKSDQATLPDGVKTLLMLGPMEPAFWKTFKQTPEFTDGTPDPMNRWSTRVIHALADDLGAQAFFPFGTQPPHPFFSWAVATGRCWPSPVMWLVHDTAGTMVSFRGALGFAEDIALPAPRPNPCDSCKDKPCLTACPVAALTGDGYDVPACHAYLDTTAGQTCLSGGCQVRLACPVSLAYGRDPEQSAFHMGYFHNLKGDPP